MTLFATSQYTRLLERLTEYEHFSLELLGFLGALGANIPNYVASIAAFFGGYGLLGIGIIRGSNIYNVAVILALAALATPGKGGIVLGKLAAREVRHLAWLVAFMGSGAGAVGGGIRLYEPHSALGGLGTFCRVCGMDRAAFAALTLRYSKRASRVPVWSPDAMKDTQRKKDDGVSQW